MLGSHAAHTTVTDTCAQAEQASQIHRQKEDALNTVLEQASRQAKVFSGKFFLHLTLECMVCIRW